MEVHKPVFVSILSRALRHRGRCSLSLAGLVLLRPDALGRWLPRTEMSLWKLLEGRLPADQPVDAGIAKQHPEYLILGSAHAPQADTTQMVVRARVGPLDKAILVSGDRYWIDDRPSRAGPIRALPLDWRHAWGGPAVDENPLGRGGPGTDVPGLGRPLPNLAPMDVVWRGPGERVRPVAFGPVPMEWPRRAALRGTYDEAWLMQHAPGLAPDLDGSFFNVAPTDQWFPTPLVGDESFSFDGMHPTLARVSGQLPGVGVRAFVHTAGHPEADALSEVPMRLTTLWFLPDVEAAVMVFHGLVACSDDDAHDVQRVMMALDDVAAPRSAEHYADVMVRRRDPDSGSLHALNEADLLPPGVRWVDPDFEAAKAAFEQPGLRGDAHLRRGQLLMQAARDHATSKGLDPDALGLKVPQREDLPDLASLPRYLADRMADVHARIEQSLAQTRGTFERLTRSIQAGEAAAVNGERRGPPQPEALNRLRAIADAMPPGAPGPDGEPVQLGEVAAALVRADLQAREHYRAFAHHQSPAYPLDDDRSQSLRGEVLARLARGESLAQWDFTGARFAGIDLSGADLTGAWLEAADLRGAVFTGAKLGGAVLAHARLDGAVLAGADLTGANLGAASVAGAVFDQALARGAILSSVDLADSSWRRADLTGAEITDLSPARADFARAKLSGLMLRRLDLRSVTLAGADLSGAMLIECDLSGTNLAAATLDRTLFTQCSLRGAALPRASVRTSVFAQGCDLTAVDLTEATLIGTNLRGQVLRSARLAGAVLDGADLSEADLAEATLTGSSLVGALLVRTRLVNAVATGANLMDAVLQRADARGLDLRASNLHGSDLSWLRTDAATRTTDALDTRARRHPMLPQEATP